ncbi:hypothetical protein ACIOHC_35930 [Streptomyces sp. NPDC088252]|uniref:hypothetical protein n=1 Tax=Streptomyces sp. NPDC088252 TaxID=3365845 RepID=UPI00382AD1EF
MPTDLTIAFAGQAANAKSNVNALVSDFLHLGSPDSEGYFEKPDRWGTLTFYVLAPDETLPLPDGLKHALNTVLSIEDSKIYLLTGKNPGDELARYDAYVDKILSFDDPLSELIDILSEAPRPHLLMNWDEADADDEQLINLAHQHTTIRVADLVQGLTAIVPDIEDEPEEEESPEPEPEERPARRGRNRKQEPEELDEEQEDLDEKPTRPVPEQTPKPAAATLEEEISTAQRAITQSAIAVGDVTVPADLLREVLAVLTAAGVYMSATDTANAAKNLAGDVRHSPLTEELGKQAEALSAALRTEESYEKALKDTAPEKAKRKPAGKAAKVVWDDDAQEWKKAGRGRPRAGARTGFMDAEGNVTED